MLLEAKITAVCIAVQCSPLCTVHSAGAVVNIRMTCLNNHLSSWSSDQFFPSTGRGRPKSRLNLALSSWILMAGLHYDSLKVGTTNIGQWKT